jgi:hypothetical protein
MYDASRVVTSWQVHDDSLVFLGTTCFAMSLEYGNRVETILIDSRDRFRLTKSDQCVSFTKRGSTRISKN